MREHPGITPTRAFPLEGDCPANAMGHTGAWRHRRTSTLRIGAGRTRGRPPTCPPSPWPSRRGRPSPCLRAAGLRKRAVSAGIRARSGAAAPPLAGDNSAALAGDNGTALRQNGEGGGRCGELRGAPDPPCAQSGPYEVRITLRKCGGRARKIEQELPRGEGRAQRRCLYIHAGLYRKHSSFHGRGADIRGQGDASVCTGF